MFERFSKAARNAVRDGVQIAGRDHAARVEAEHLLLGILAQDRTPGTDILVRHAVTTAAAREAIDVARRRGGLSTADAEALTGLGIDVDAVVAAVEHSHGEGALAAAGRRGRSFGWRVPLSPECKRVLQRCLVEVVERGENTIGDEHLLLAILRTGGTAADVLTGFGVTYEVVRDSLAKA
ncbi:Clp protease N-terminal domain-containing protein [Actinokineospora spheciospongiae]|uniref:Clp protease N-terminal domain-containing protein n=1 Tax=Actinokineospora spheciospongiae TaxID=909613 RepID=UPI000D715319|nr:Clp protease N-terminal domain-containing protein [Actinokineospora spheciospongiae]PWW64104.1 ClpA/ClpB-like protein [Actinokineospora spheciospongiae]